MPFDSIEAKVSRGEQRLVALERWQDACEWIPRALAELVQWKRDQNSDIHEIKEDIREMKTTIQGLTIGQGRKRLRSEHKDRALKWILAGVAFGSFMTALLTNIL